MLKNVSNIIQGMLNYVSNVIYFTVHLRWLKKVVLTFSNTWMHAVICKVIGFMEYCIWILWAKCMLINVCVMHRLMAISIQKQSSGHWFLFTKKVVRRAMQKDANFFLQIYTFTSKWAVPSQK